MKTYLLERDQWIPRPRAAVFDFFSHAENLGAITPPWMHFEICTPLPIEMREGTLIDYRIRLAGIPMRWQTRISLWQPGRRFVDEQMRGPYALWQHTHEFLEKDDGVLMTDRVRYALPLGTLGRIVHALAVQATVSAIFDYRFGRIAELVEGNVAPEETG
jgi:ligand-binding SRPBCC domain-containing protein